MFLVVFLFIWGVGVVAFFITEKQGDLPSAGSCLESLHIVRANPRAQNSTWASHMAETHVLNPSFAASQVHISRKLELEPETPIWDVHVKQQCNCYSQHSPLHYLFIPFSLNFGSTLSEDKG